MPEFNKRLHNARMRGENAKPAQAPLCPISRYSAKLREPNIGGLVMKIATFNIKTGSKRGIDALPQMAGRSAA